MTGIILKIEQLDFKIKSAHPLVKPGSLSLEVKHLHSLFCTFPLKSTEYMTLERKGRPGYEVIQVGELIG